MLTGQSVYVCVCVCVRVAKISARCFVQMRSAIHQTSSSKHCMHATRAIDFKVG